MIRQLALLFLFFVILFVASIGAERAFSPSFQSCIQENPEKKSDTSTKEHQTGVIFTVSIYTRCTGRFIDDNGNGITALATIVIAAFTGTLWFATTKQVAFAEQAFIMDRRALISADTFMQFFEFDAASNTYSWRLRPRWRNTGGTSSQNLSTYVECEIRNTALPDGYPFNYRMADAGQGNVLVARADMLGGIAPAPTGAPITAQDIADAQAGRRYIYLWGIARYFDVFPKTPEHVFHFCWLIVATGNPFGFQPNTPGQPPIPGTLAFSLIQHKEGNYET